MVFMLFIYDVNGIYVVHGVCVSTTGFINQAVCTYKYKPADGSNVTIILLSAHPIISSYLSSLSQYNQSLTLSGINGFQGNH